MYGALVTARGNTLNMVSLSSGAQREHFFFRFFYLKASDEVLNVA